MQWTWNSSPTFPARGTSLEWDIKFQANGAEYIKLSIERDVDGHRYIGYTSSSGATLAYDGGTWLVASRDILFEENISDDLFEILNKMATTTQPEIEAAGICAVLKVWSPQSVYPYIIMSNVIEIASNGDNNNTAYSVWVKKVGALYDVKVLNE